MKKIITLVVFLLIARAGSAQSEVKASFGTLPYDEKNIHSGTIEQILANPQIILNNKSYHVDSFFVSFLPAQPADLVGPFTSAGDKLSPRIMNSLRDMGGKKGILFIDNVMVSASGGKRIVTNNVLVKYTR